MSGAFVRQTSISGACTHMPVVFWYTIHQCGRQWQYQLMRPAPKGALSLVRDKKKGRRFPVSIPHDRVRVSQVHAFRLLHPKVTLI